MVPAARTVDRLHVLSPVMAGLVPATGRGGVPLPVPGTSPGMTNKKKGRDKPNHYAAIRTGNSRIACRKFE